MPSSIRRLISAFALASTVYVFLMSVPTAEAADSVTIVPVPEGGHPVAARTDSKGTIHLIFRSADGPQYRRSIDGGKSFGNAIPVVDRGSRKPGLEFSVWDLAVSPGGYVHVAMGTNAWKLKLPEEEWALHYTSLEPDASEFSPVRNINHKPSEGFSLAADDKGRVTATWLSGKLYANVSHDNGTTFGPNVEIDSTIDPCDCCTTSATYGADGKLALLYREESNNDRDMFLVLWNQERNESSRTRVSSTLWEINACPMSYFEVTRDRQGFVAVWPTKGDVYFARLDGKGVPLSPGEIKTSGTTGMRTGMLTLTAADGSTLVAWKKKGVLNWQLYDQGGRPSGSPGSAASEGDSVAGVLNNKSEFVLFK
jgi:hypothetical protein